MSQSEGPAPCLDIEPKFLFGLSNGIPSGNCLFLEEELVVYPASGVIILYNIVGHNQRFIHLAESREVVTAMSLNTSDRVLAVATVKEDSAGVEDKDNGHNGPVVSIYDIKFSVLNYVFVEPKIDTIEADTEVDGKPPRTDERQERRRRFVNMWFLPYDTVAAIAVGPGGTDCVMYFYGWKTSVVNTYVHLNGHVADVALNPIDTSICCFVGKDLFRLMTKTESKWTQYGFCEASGIDFTSVEWLCGDRCLAGTADGRVILFKNGVLKAVYQVDSLQTLEVTIKQEIERLNVVSPSRVDSLSVRGCFVFEFGFLLVVGISSVYYFRKMDEGQRYFKCKVFEMQEDHILQSQNIGGNLLLHEVQSISISPSGDKFVCVTRRTQLYWASLIWPNDEDNESLDSVYGFKPLGVELHHGGVESLSTSLWCPILMTCGTMDFTIKLWDYSTGKILITKQYTKQVMSVCIHPTGHYSVAAFSDHVEFQMIQTDDLVTLKNFPIREGRVVAFSDNASMFAVALLNVIEVYCGVLLDKRFTCIGHLKTVQSMVWSNNDLNIIAFDEMGAISKFDTKNGKVLMHIEPSLGTSLTGLIAAKDANRIFVTAVDGTLKKIIDREVYREVNFHQGSLKAVCISPSNSILYVATENGVILSIILPMMYQIVHKEFKMHSHSIKKMCISSNGRALFSCSEDGSLCIWEIKGISDNVIYPDDKLVSWAELKNKSDDIKRTKEEVRKLKTETALAMDKLRSEKEEEIENMVNENLKNYHDENEKKKEIMSNVPNEDIRELEKELVALRESFEQSVHWIDTKYTEILGSKYKKYMILENKMSSKISKLENDLDMLRKKINKELQELIDDCDEKLKEKIEDISNSKEKLIHEKNCMRELVGDIQKDLDENLVTEKDSLDARLIKTRELYAKTMSEIAENKMKQALYSIGNADSRRLIDTLINNLNELKELSANKKTAIINLTRLLKNFKDLQPISIRKLDEAKLTLDRLCKKRDALNEYIDESKRAADPVEFDIQELKNSIEQKEIVYDDLLKSFKNLESLFDKTKRKNASYDKKLKLLQKDVSSITNTFSELMLDLLEASVHHSLKKQNEITVNTFFDKYIGSNSGYMVQKDELQAKEEFIRHKKTLEYYIGHLNKVVKLYDTKNESHYLLMEENTKLLEEVNALRNEAKSYFDKYYKLEKLMSEVDPDENLSDIQIECEESMMDE